MPSMKTKFLFLFLTCYAVLSVRVSAEVFRADSLKSQSMATCFTNQEAKTSVELSFFPQVADFFSLLFNTESWPPRWQCGEWTSFHGWLYIISDLITGICYFLIPLSLWVLLYNKNNKYKSFRRVILLFIIFILACGSTHFIDASIFWWPTYRLSALLRFITAIASVVTVIAMVKYAPKILQLRSPESLEKLVMERTVELREVNLRLQQEIEHRKLAEKELTKREKRFRALIENMSDGIVLNDENSNILYQSPSVSRILGYTLDERKQKPVINYIHEDDKEDFKKLYENLANSPGRPLPFQFRFKHRNGNYIWLEGVVTNLLHDRNVNGYVANYRDISERKEAEEKLRHERYLLRTLIDNLPVYIYIKDTQLRHVINNKANVELIGAANEEETIGKTVLDYFDTTSALEFMQADRKVLESGMPVLGLEEKIIGHTNEVRWLLTSKIPLIEHNQTVGLVGISQDITERKKAELVLNELNASLATQASKLAASNTELERFAYVASHDLQEPLRMVRSFLQLLKKKYEGQLDDKAREYIDFAVDGSERMKKLIMDLLEYSRVGFVPTKFELINMNEVVQRTLQILHESIKSSGAEIRVNHLPSVYGIKTQLEQVVLNLITNALKYRKEGTPIITIQAEEGSTHWKFSISDNGIGIEPRFFDKIFIIFQRLNNHSEQRGSGLGLAICKKIVEGHKGTIWVDSKMDSGSTFCFTVCKKL
jgi:two-component system CheB/CheR fusion protein